MTGGGEDLCIGDLLSADGVGSLQEFHDDSELIPAEDRGGIVEGWIGAEIHVAWCGHHVANPEVHGTSITRGSGRLHTCKKFRLTYSVIPNNLSRSLFRISLYLGFDSTCFLS